MRDQAPTQLSGLLQRLGLASESDLQGVAPTVDRLTGDLPHFQSVWIDALRQARSITQYQAAEIMAQRGEKLRIGRYVLCHIVHKCGFCTIYKAEGVETRDAVRLAIIASQSSQTDGRLTELQKLAAMGERLPHITGLISSAGQDGARVWAAAPWVEGTSVAEWMLHHGRFRPDAVLEIGRAMLADLAAMESVDLVHGDIRAENVLLLPDGKICLPHAGLRPIVRPCEGIAHGGISPEACGTLSPERVSRGALPCTSSDLFACGCVWWQMLCGRPPLGGGDTLSRLRAAQAGSIDDFRRWATDVPQPLADAITACLQKDPRQRPASMADLAGRLGSPSRAGRQAMARCLTAAERPLAPWLYAARQRPRRKHPHLATAATLLMLALIAVAWPLWVAASRPRAVASASATVPIPPDRPKGQSRDSRPPAVNSINDTGQERADTSPVVQAGYNEPIGSKNVLWLPGDCAIPASALRLEPGQVVRPRSGRARVAVLPRGLEVPVDRITFENIDFVADETAATSAATSNTVEPTLVRLAGLEYSFIGCSFQSPVGRPQLCTAIQWRRPDARDAIASLPSGRIRMENCVFRRVAAGIESSGCGAVVINIVNTLHLGPGPMIRLMQGPAADEPLRIALAQVTVREASARSICARASAQAIRRLSKSASTPQPLFSPCRTTPRY